METIDEKCKNRLIPPLWSLVKKFRGNKLLEMREQINFINYVYAIDYSNNGTKIVTSSYDIRIYDANNGTHESTFREHKHYINSVKFHPLNPDLFLSASNNVTLWNVNCNYPLHIFNLDPSGCRSGDHKSFTNHLIFHPFNSNIVFATSSHGDIYIFDIEIGKTINTIYHNKDHDIYNYISSIDVKNNLLAYSYSDTITMIDTRTLKHVKEIEAKLPTFCFHKNQNIIICASEYYKGMYEISMLSLYTGKCIHKVTSVPYIRSLCSNNSYFALGSAYGSVDICDTTTFKNVETIGVDKNRGITSLAFHPLYNNILASGSEDRCVRIWEI